MEEPGGFQRSSALGQSTAHVQGELQLGKAQAGGPGGGAGCAGSPDSPLGLEALR